MTTLARHREDAGGDTDDATHWSPGDGQATGMSQSGVSPSGGFRLKPHCERLQTSPDPFFIEKVRTSWVFISIRPEPPGAVRRREDPGAGARSHRSGATRSSGLPERATHDYVRNGTPTSSRLDMASGKSSPDMTDRHEPFESQVLEP